jgi:hypothetical protein
MYCTARTKRSTESRKRVWFVTTPGDEHILLDSVLQVTSNNTSKRLVERYVFLAMKKLQILSPRLPEMVPEGWGRGFLSSIDSLLLLFLELRIVITLLLLVGRRIVKDSSESDQMVICSAFPSSRLFGIRLCAFLGKHKV